MKVLSLLFSFLFLFYLANATLIIINSTVEQNLTFDLPGDTCVYDNATNNTFCGLNINN